MLEELEDSREAVGARLKKVREILGMAKKEFAEKAGISEQVYGPFENAKRDLSLQSAKKLRKAYSLPLDFLYFGKTDDLPTRISREL
ncbi:helix-turn-helix domain-containing protein [Pseudooceanicola atlanticus]|uniref:XRE family transcriptional regulator n=1 Tax=Pseudooceanicola atlanticus TaxID=1461694 RepID=A0A0A0E8Z7_9RHOB|nr:helix-turn-helix transcriptional regulator [Pseudooceanicola atlanticus]KGM47451.1 XRE family transcriptional regulator [Pseudooceanicola atlanticus]